MGINNDISEEEPKSFKLGADEPEEEPIPPLNDLDEERPSSGRIDRLQRRVTMILFLMPVLVAVLGALVLFVIYTQILSPQRSESQKVEELGKLLEERFSSLSAKQTKLETDSGKAASSIQDSTGKLEKKFQDTVTKVESGISGKIGKEELQKGLAGHQEQLSSLGSALNSLKSSISEIKSAREDFRSEAKGISTKLYETVENVARLQEAIPAMEEKVKTALSSGTQVRNTLDALQRDRVGKRDLIEQAQGVRSELLQQLDRINKRISDLETRYRPMDSKLIQLENALDANERALERLKLEMKFPARQPSPGSSGQYPRSGGISEQPLP